MNSLICPLCFQCMPFISSYLSDDAMMLPQHLPCMSEFDELLRLFESQVSMGDSKMQLDKF